MSAPQPLIVGIGGTSAPGSSTERALEVALHRAREKGARTTMFGGSVLGQLPLYGTQSVTDGSPASTMIASIRQADGLIIASPGYHGSVSGMIKNALDYLEETARDDRVYLDGLPVGLIVTAYGWQATGSTLAALRSIVHALRGWPSPLGAAVNSANRPFDGGVCTDPKVREQLETVGYQVFRFARIHMLDDDTLATA